MSRSVPQPRATLARTGWNKSDSEAYYENRVQNVPTEKINSDLEAVVRPTRARINSFNYFVKEIVALTDPRNRACAF